MLPDGAVLPKQPDEISWQVLGFIVLQVDIMVVSANSKTGIGNVFIILMSTLLLIGLSLNLVSKATAAPKFSSIVVDARTGKILSANNADARRYPASLTKMMTLYLVFEDLRDKRISMNTRLRVSRYAASRPPSKLGFKPGRTIMVRDAIKALVTKSANDVATAIAENLGGSESRFARRMTSTARRLGMTRTTFRNASGLPNRAQMTTARDMATLGLRLQRDFPRYYKFFSTRRFTFRGHRYGNHNRLLGRIQGVDGIKTGYTRASGFNLTSSARRGNKRIVAVVMGGRTGRSRNRHMAALIKKTFATKRLTNSTRIAAVAGTPPGYKKLMRTIQVASKKRAPFNPPLPQQKPLTISTKPVIVAIKKPARIVKQQDRLAPDQTLDRSAVSTFKTASIIDDNGQKDILPFDNDKGSPAVRKSDKGDLKISKPVKVQKSVQMAQTKLPDADTTPHQDSWNIQIGAFPSKESATGRLASATKKAQRNLRGKVPFTIEVRKNGAKFYRARFAGFNRKTAKRACRTLSKKGIGCFALAPRS